MFKIKDKIIMFVIGVLVGAIIATGAFYIYTSTNNSGNNMGMNGGTPPSLPNGEMPSGQQPPEMPNNNQNSSN